MAGYKVFKCLVLIHRAALPFGGLDGRRAIQAGHHGLHLCQHACRLRRARCVVVACNMNCTCCLKGCYMQYGVCDILFNECESLLQARMIAMSARTAGELAERQQKLGQLMSRLRKVRYACAVPLQRICEVLPSRLDFTIPTCSWLRNTTSRY